MTGTPGYAGGWLNPRAGMAQRPAYARGLARMACSAGAQIVPQSPGTALAQDVSGWTVTTRLGPTRAGFVLIATGTYSDDRLVPCLAHSFLTAKSNITPTSLLPDQISRSILPFGGALSETRKLAFYVCMTHDKRLVFGRRGAIGQTHGTKLKAALDAAMRRMFPQLVGRPVAHAWSGDVKLAMDGGLHLHQPKSVLSTSLGFNGRSVAMATATGKMIAQYITDKTRMALPLTDLHPVPCHGVRGPVMWAGIDYYWTKDAMGLPG